MKSEIDKIVSEKDPHTIHAQMHFNVKHMKNIRQCELQTE